MSVQATFAELSTAVADLMYRLEQAVEHLEATQDYLTSHGVHSDTVEARKLLDRLS